MFDALFWWVGCGIVSVLGGCVAAEGLLRLRRGLTALVRSPVRRHDYLDVAYHPYIDWTDSWDRAMFTYVPFGLRLFNLANPVSQVRNNTLGFRTYEFAECALAHREDFRIAVLGGSAGWGFGASSNENTIPGQLEALVTEHLRTEGNERRARVYNLCQVNQTQTQDLVVAAQYFASIEPHLVLHYGGWNEIATSIAMDEDVLSRYDIFPVTEMVGWEPSAVGQNARRELLRSLYLLSRKWSLVGARLLRGGASHTSQLRRTIEENLPLASPIFVRNMQRLQRLCEGYGAAFVQVCQPNLYRKKRLTPAEERAVELYDVHRPVLGGKMNGDFLRAVNLYAQVEEYACEVGVEEKLLNLEGIFMDDPGERYFSLVHCRNDGYAAIAAEITRALVSRGLLEACTP